MHLKRALARCHRNRKAMKLLSALSILCFVLISNGGILSPTPRLKTYAALTLLSATATSTQRPLSAAPISTLVSSANRFGVIISGQDVARREVVNAVKNLGAEWVRLNLKLGTGNQGYTLFLASGINVILTVSNQDPSNIVVTYGTLRQWPNAGFPFKSQTQYQQRIRAVLQPALPYLTQGQQLWMQAENEIIDATVNPVSTYWRGTEEQYLAQLQALYEAVKSVNADIPVVSTSFASRTLDALSEQNDARHELAVRHVARLLTQGQLDAVDLHFYGCVEDIAAKVKAVKERTPAGKQFIWISTENGGPDFRCKTTPISWKQNLAQFEQLQAKQVSARLSACAENGGSICLWFSFLDQKKSDDVFSHLGLVDQGTNPPRRKPAYEAFKAFVAKQKK